MRSLDFMIVGAQKCGTTALATFLAEHPEIIMSDPKEVHAFDQPGDENVDLLQSVRSRYREAFPSALVDHRLLGEATPIYMFLPGIPSRLAGYNPKLKLIVLLRDPVERAFSQYRMEYQRGDERLPYTIALLVEHWRLMRDSDPYDPRSATRHHAYRARGLYSRQLSEIYSHFHPSQVMVIRTDALRFQHEKTLNAVFHFLGLDAVHVSPQAVFQQEPASSPLFANMILKLSYRSELRKLARMVDFSVEDWR